MDLGCLYWLQAFSCTKHCLSGSVERQQQTPFNRIFEEQRHEKEQDKNWVNGTNPYAFCTKLVNQIYDIVDLIIYFCAIKIVQVSLPAPFFSINLSNNKCCGVGALQRIAMALNTISPNPVYMIDGSFCMMLPRL